MALWLQVIVTACFLLSVHGQEEGEGLLESPGPENVKLEPVEVTLHRNNRRQGEPDGPWCNQAKQCQRDRLSICGFDENFGFGRFEDFCHLLEVNCYWNYNFVLHSCKPLYLKKLHRGGLGQGQN